ncbi:MAG: hypothetical protein V1901_00680 [Patescibacteria group bacterium]|nr:hypothetical protein [Patescibacteria group bacterium]
MNKQKQSDKINLLHQSDDIQPDIQKDLPEIPKKTGLPKWVTILITVLVIAVIGIGGYFAYSHYFGPGVCINQCGDGQCGEIVCQAIGCPCAETIESCPEDCKKEEITDPTADWQTYRNEELEFEVKHPKDWTTTQVSPHSVLIENDKGFKMNFSMPPLGGGYCIENKEYIIVNNSIEVIKYTCAGFNDFLKTEQRQVVINFLKETSNIKEDALLVILHTNPNNISSNDFLDLSNQILSTFKFIE